MTTPKYYDLTPIHLNCPGVPVRGTVDCSSRHCYTTVLKHARSSATPVPLQILWPHQIIWPHRNIMTSPITALKRSEWTAHSLPLYRIGFGFHCPRIRFPLPPDSVSTAPRFGSLQIMLNMCWFKTLRYQSKSSNGFVGTVNCPRVWFSSNEDFYLLISRRFHGLHDHPKTVEQWKWNSLSSCF
jgi:hypothetical protein